MTSCSKPSGRDSKGVQSCISQKYRSKLSSTANGEVKAHILGTQSSNSSQYQAVRLSVKERRSDGAFCVSTCSAEYVQPVLQRCCFLCSRTISFLGPDKPCLVFHQALQTFAPIVKVFLSLESTCWLTLGGKAAQSAQRHTGLLHSVEHTMIWLVSHCTLDFKPECRQR